MYELEFVDTDLRPPAPAGAHDAEVPPRPACRWPRVGALLLGAAVALACGGGDRVAPPTGEVWESTTTTEGDVTTVRTLAGSVWGGPGRLEPELTIGVAQGEDPYMFGSVSSIAATDEEIYVLDSEVPALRVYDRDGNHLRDIGARGEGPGEFMRPDAVLVDAEGRILVHDAQGDRFNVFDADGELLETWPPRMQGNMVFVGGTVVLAADGTVYTQGRMPDPESEGGGGRGGGGGSFVISTGGGGGFSMPAAAMFPRDAEGEAGDPIPVPTYELPSSRLTAQIRSGDSFMMTMSSVPFAPGSYWSLSPAGAMVAGASDDYSFEIIYPDGAKTVVEKVWEPVPVAPEEAEWHRARITASMRERTPEWTWNGPEIPATRPAFDGIFTDQSGRVWVLRQGPGVHNPDCHPDPATAAELGEPCWENSYFADVFDLEGAFLGRVDIPEHVTLGRNSFIRGDEAYLRGEDELGTYFVRRFRLVVPTARADD